MTSTESNLSPDARAEFPTVPWRSISAMRNRLIHGYFSIDLDRVWDTLTDDIPTLLAALEADSPDAGEPTTGPE